MHVRAGLASIKFVPLTFAFAASLGTESRMASEFDPAEQWERVAAELRTHKQTQQQAWGDIDNATLGRYLAGDLADDERQSIEQALTQLPELRKLTDIVRDVLDEFDPAAPVPLPEAPQVLPFPPQAFVKKPFRRFLSWRTAALAASVLLGIGLVLGGMQLFRSTNSGQEYALTVPDRPEQPNEQKKDGHVAAQHAKIVPSADVKAPERQSAEMAEGWKQVSTAATTLLASTQEEVGTFYEKKGDYDWAAYLLANAHDLRRSAQGDGDEATVKTTQTLANVYQVALNTTPPTEQHGVRSFAMTLPAAPEAAILPVQLTNRDAAYPKACALRERLTRQKSEEVKQSVVPVLVAGLRSAKTSAERQRFAHALGALGPTAADAVADLKSALEAKDTPNEERVVVVWALGQMGAASRPALPVLLDSLQGNCPELKQAAGEALVKLSPYARQDVLANAKKEPLPQDVLARIQGPEGSSGLNDACSCCCPQVLHETQRQIQLLARRHHVELFAETIPGAADKSAPAVADRAKETPTNGIYILICKEPPSVQVVVSEALRKKGFTLECQKELNRLVEEGVRKRDFDGSLLQAVRYVAQRFEQTANRTKAGVGLVGGSLGLSLLPH